MFKNKCLKKQTKNQIVVVVVNVVVLRTDKEKEGEQKRSEALSLTY